MAHVFIVDTASFPVHLEYRFAGTTAGDRSQRSTPLYADIARVRPGDRVYYYLLNRGFYGPFRADPDRRGPWWDPLSPSYLQERLGRRLIYRLDIVPDNPYPLPIPEWDALDRYLREPDRCLWSLVYRKLKGQRGCTMIFPWEDEFLLDLIAQANQDQHAAQLAGTPSMHLTCDPTTHAITALSSPPPKYEPPDPNHTSTPDDPLQSLRSSAGSESHLQAYLLKQCGYDDQLESIFGPASTITWLGNEVACGLGMQKIDLFVINLNPSGPIYRIIELKKDPPDATTIRQLHRYIDWTKRFVPTATSSNIQPVLVCRNLRNQSPSSAVTTSIREFNQRSGALPVQYVECRRTLDGAGVTFAAFNLE